MTQASEQIARQFANASLNSINWSTIIFNVKAYGVVGDGIHDDAPAIQALINMVSNLGGGILQFPPGTYLLSSFDSANNCHLYMFNRSRITLQGSGQSTILKANSTNKDLIRVSGGSERVTIRDIVLDRIPGAVSGGNGIHFYNWYANRLWNGYNVTIERQFNGLYASTARPQGSRWVSCSFENNINDGVNLTMNNDEFFDTCSMSGNGRHGLTIGGSYTVESNGTLFVSNCSFYGNGKDGIHCEGTSAYSNLNVLVVGGQIDNNGGYGFFSAYTQNLQLRTTITFANKSGAYFGFGCNEVNATGLIVSDCAEEGIYVAPGANFVNLSGASVLSCGRNTSKEFYGIKIDSGVDQVNMTGVISGNALNNSFVGNRQTQDGGILLVGNGSTPNNIIIVGCQFPGMTKKITISGTAGTDIVQANNL